MENRDEILALDDAALAERCRIETFMGSGAGGQHRNRNSTAVRAVLTGTEYRAEDCTERSQARNRTNALRKLRMKIACGERRAVREKPIRKECSPDSPYYPVYTALTLDMLYACGWDYRAAAEQLGLTPSGLLKILRRDPEIWMTVNRNRQTAGLRALTC